MSYIFDALQRSEHERSGDTDREQPEATDLLLIAERRAVHKWETESQSSCCIRAETAEQYMPVRVEAIQPDDASLKTCTNKKELPNGNETDLFTQVQIIEGTSNLENRMICLNDDDNPAMGSFRLLAVRLTHLRRQRQLQTLLITSTIPQEGKSMVAANLACALSLRTQHKIILVEGDLRRPKISSMFGLAMRSGLREYLMEGIPLAKSVYYLKKSNIWIMPAGHISDIIRDPLESTRLSELLTQLSTCFEWVIIDSPPVLPLADTTIWMRLADGVLVVTREGITKRRQLQKGLESIEPQKLIGALLNCTTNSDNDSYYYCTQSAVLHDNT